MPGISKLRLLKEVQKCLLSTLQEAKSMQTTGSVFAERIELVEREFTKTVNCFLDGFGTYDSNLIVFRRIFS